MSTRIAFLKGHGTENDFVIVPDPENAIDLRSRSVLTLTGSERRAWLHNISTQHVSDLPDGGTSADSGAPDGGERRSATPGAGAVKPPREIRSTRGGLTAVT